MFWLGVKASVSFYPRMLGMTETTFADGRKALLSRSSKINLHRAGHEFAPKAAAPTPGKRGPGPDRL